MNYILCEICMLIGIAVGVLIEKVIKVYEERAVLTTLEQEWSTRCNYYRKELRKYKALCWVKGIEDDNTI